ncbi:protein charlatan [Onthophagus taurus]|uniref:protein charlatan n=1 Tax=Onthophagus taurus TaxID=166361 RepID=UPI000C20C7F6|nr:protein charlatan [Onthophagus taurus]
MEVPMPMAGNAIDCYEDMFKEITRKLYGEDGLPELNTLDRHNGQQDRGLTPIDYDVETPILKSEEHITAFGLAALMQNGFPPASILNSQFQQHRSNQNYEDKWVVNEDGLNWTQSKIASYNGAQKLFRCTECECVGYMPRVVEHWLGTHSNLRVFQCSQCPYESAWVKCVRTHLSRQHNINSEETIDLLLKNNLVHQELTRYLQQLKNKVDSTYLKPASSTTSLDEYQNVNVNRQPQQNQHVSSNEANGSGGNKRYSCSYCPYATDRRDLFTRHENIHREEKPFQCYICQKQFNRADHVKKHFLRMHREHPYDLNRIRRHPPKNASGMSYYQKYNSTGIQEPTEQMNLNLGISNSLAIANSFNNLARNSQNRTTDVKPGNKPHIKPSGKKKGEKRFSCCYCSWSGVDNWCLKRHMNTHLKPFVCGLCDYKAARSERLATHVLKVHNKRSCGKCNFLADDPAQLSAHQQDHHPLDQRNGRNGNVLRNSSYTSNVPSANTTTTNQSSIKSHELNPASVLLQHNNRLLQQDSKSWKPHTPKQHGAARLFNYMEASDGSEPEADSKGAEDMSRVNLSHRIHSDFPEAGDVGSSLDEYEEDEVELPLFVCHTCGCEFEDDGSLATHSHIHNHGAASPAKFDDSKENINPRHNYRCQICKSTFVNQQMVITHMNTHSTLSHNSQNSSQKEIKRPRKQSQPKKVLSLFQSQSQVSGKGLGELVDKHMAQFVTAKTYCCRKCRNAKICQFRRKTGLMLHEYWRHSKRNFACEHCNVSFKHRYQVVLHSSRVHVKRPCKSGSDDTLPNHLNNAVPDIPSSTNSVHKLGVPFFDHSFLHSNTGINNHMPIIIPTFPPN